jgi:hypothetical protein
MTTNRIFTVDIAVQSRIHYAIHFGRLDQSQTTRIWDTFKSQLTDKNSNEEGRADIGRWFEKNLEFFSQTHMNGREIRNLFTTAQLLAFCRDGKICLDDVERVYAAANSFRNHLRDYRHDTEMKNSTGKNDYMGF